MKHPYIGLPDRQFWKKEKGIQDGALLDPVSPPPFSINHDDRIVTAGSCFAQHVAKHMSSSGYNHFIVEKAHPVIHHKVAEKHNYGMFSARYGNVYTARQLKQLLLRAYGKFDPVEVSWPSKDSDSIVDPFRPQIQPGGFLSKEELVEDRNHHFSCIRKVIEQMDVFVFTLGLTECWEDSRDGAIFPIAPGVAGGEFDENLVNFRNFDEDETFQDLKSSLEFIRSINPDCKVVLTVSPVALNATYEDRHVLLSTTWSKSVLRIAVEKVSRYFEDCVYFPSYEIITSPHVRGKYFANDCREVLKPGVDHVMALFLKHFTDGVDSGFKKPSLTTSEDRHSEEMEEKLEALCDEAAINNDSDRKGKGWSKILTVIFGSRE